MKNLLAIAAVVLSASACSKASSESAAQEAPAAPVEAMREFAVCDNLGYWGGYVVSVKESSTSNGAEITVERVRGPDGDGWDMEAKTVAGTKINGDDRDPYSNEYKFGDIGLSIVLERSDDSYPAELKIDGEVEGLSCKIN